VILRFYVFAQVRVDKYELNRKGHPVFIKIKILQDKDESETKILY